jgi:hypothetical protein
MVTVFFCILGRLIIGGTAGQVVVLDLMDSDVETTLNPVKTDLVLTAYNFLLRFLGPIKENNMPPFT